METRELYRGARSQSAPAAYSILLRNVYQWMALALVVTGLTAAYVAGNHNMITTIMTNKFLFWGLLIGEVLLVMYISSRINALSFATAGLLFAAYAILNGVTLSILFVAYTAASLASTFFITAGTFAAMALVGYFTKRDLSSMGRILIMALIGIIIATVVNIFMKSTMLYWITTYAGVLIFVGLTAYDSQKIKQMLMQAGDEVNEGTQK